MPEMTGIELAKEILAIRADMPIIMCTGFSHTVDADSATTVGIKAFVMKPLTKREIARTIRKVLDELGLKRRFQFVIDRIAELSPYKARGCCRRERNSQVSPPFHTLELLPVFVVLKFLLSMP